MFLRSVTIVRIISVIMISARAGKTEKTQIVQYENNSNDNKSNNSNDWNLPQQPKDQSEQRLAPLIDAEWNRFWSAYAKPDSEIDWFDTMLYLLIIGGSLQQLQMLDTPIDDDPTSIIELDYLPQFLTHNGLIPDGGAGSSVNEVRFRSIVVSFVRDQNLHNYYRDLKHCESMQYVHDRIERGSVPARWAPLFETLRDDFGGTPVNVTYAQIFWPFYRAYVRTPWISIYDMSDSTRRKAELLLTVLPRFAAVRRICCAGGGDLGVALQIGRNLTKIDLAAANSAVRCQLLSREYIYFNAALMLGLFLVYRRYLFTNNRFELNVNESFAFKSMILDRTILTNRSMVVINNENFREMIIMIMVAVVIVGIVVVVILIIANHRLSPSRFKH